MLFVFAMSVSGITLALDPPKSDSSNKSVNSPLLTRDQAAKRAQAQLGGGRVLGIKLHSGSSSVPYFDVKLLDGGKVRVLRIDAQ